VKIRKKNPIEKIREIAKLLRADDGCAWDKKQTSQTLKPYLIEETYELYDAIESNDIENTKEELGDLLYQIYAHCQIAEEQGLFSIDDVAEGISQKLITRHPHVFDEAKNLKPEEVAEQWEKIKKVEKHERHSILDGIPKHLPALLKAYRIQQKVSRLGFDWEEVNDAIKKLDEEIEEFKEAIKLDDKKNILEEAGDVLFSIVNILRFKKINSEEALQKTNKKFTKRFQYIEKTTNKLGKKIEDMTLKELDKLWEEAKEKLNENR